jgi:CRISPR-associated protein Csh2
MMAEEKTLSGRREFLFLYDIKMGNPNGDPDENRPRVLPDGTYYVTDVRLKRFARDFLKARGNDILVDNIEGKTTNLTGRVVNYLNAKGLKQANGSELVDILLDSFIDARLFGSSFAFTSTKIENESTEADDKIEDKKEDKKKGWKAKPEPKTMTGAVQINMGEVLHRAQPVDIHGTSIFGSAEEKGMGTFTTYFGLRYALIAFSGVANEHSAKISRLTDDDYELFLKALWHGVRSAANTRTKVGQVPRLLISVDYQGGEEFQFGRLHDYVKLVATAGKDAKEWSSPDDYRVDLGRFIERLQGQAKRIKAVRYCISPDIICAAQLPADWQLLDAETL